MSPLYPLHPPGHLPYRYALCADLVVRPAANAAVAAAGAQAIELRGGFARVAAAESETLRYKTLMKSLVGTAVTLAPACMWLWLTVTLLRGLDPPRPTHTEQVPSTALKGCPPDLPQHQGGGRSATGTRGRGIEQLREPTAAEAALVAMVKRVRAARSPVEETHLGWSAKAVCWTRTGKKQGEQGTRMEVHGLELAHSTTSLLSLPPPYSHHMIITFAPRLRPDSPIQIPTQAELESSSPTPHAGVGDGT